MDLDKDRILSLQRAYEAIVANKSLYLLEISSDAKVLFRVDGLIIQVSDVVFDLLQSESCLEDRVRRAILFYGSEAVEEAVDAIREASLSPVVRTEPEPLARPNVARSQPAGILIMVTQTCNLACSYCYAGGGTYGGKTKLMPEEDALRAIDVMLQRAPQRREFTVTFFGGEPLLNFPLVRRIVSYCNSLSADLGMHFHFSMTTNCTIVSDEIVQFLKTNQFTLMVSFDGLGQETHRPFADGSSSAHLVRENLRRLAASGVAFQIRATITRDLASKETVDELVQIGKSLGDKRVMISTASATRNSIFPAHEELTLRMEEASRLREICRSVTAGNIEAARNGSTEKTVFDPNLYLVQALANGKAAGLGRCGAGLAMAAASTDGNIYPCHRFVGMKDYVIGTIESGVDSDAVQSFFREADEVNKEKCDACFARQICGGFCFYNISNGKGGFVPPDERECESFRENVKYAIGTLLRLRESAPEEARQYFENSRL